MGVRILLGTPSPSLPSPACGGGKGGGAQTGKAAWLKPNCLEIRLLPRAPDLFCAAVAQSAEAAGLNPVLVQDRRLPAAPNDSKFFSGTRFRFFGNRLEALSSEEERRSYKPKVEIS